MLNKLSEHEHILFHRDILHEIHDGVMICNHEGRLFFMNRSAEAIFQIISSEWIGRHVAELIPNSVIYRALTTQTPQIRTLSKLKDKNFIVHASPIIADGSVIGAISTFKDDFEIQQLTKKYESLKKYVNYLQIKLEHSTEPPFPFINFITAKHSPMVEIIMQITKASATDLPILLRGESGVGKEIIAKAIHDSSGTAGPFVTVNCAAIPDALLESELFGYEEGAFTGAKKNGKKGKFELANGGSIFLDEIGDMNYNIQAKLLRVLQQKELVKVGGNHPLPLNVRVISATHQNLESMIQEGTFREDLYYRINGISFEIPPLRERKMDIEALIQHFTEELSNKYGRKFIISDEAKRFMINHPLRGNVRELKQAIEYAVIMCEDEEIQTLHFPKSFVNQNKKFTYPVQPPLPTVSNANTTEPTEEFSTLNLSHHLMQLEKKLIKEALKRTGSNHTKSIQMLGISRQTYYDRLKMYKDELGLS